MEGAHLVGKGAGIGFQGRLGGGVVGLEGDVGRGGYGADEQNPSPTLPAQNWQHRPVHGDAAEEIHIKLTLGGLRLRKLHGTGDAEAGAVYHNVNAPLLGQNLIHGGLHCFLLGYIHG